MERGFAARLHDRALANARGVRAAPEVFLLLAVITFGVSYFAFRQVQGERLAVLENRVASQEALLADYRTKANGATQEEAAAQIEKLTTMLADAQKELDAAKTKSASLDGPSRDPHQLYDDDNPIALVGDPMVDVDNKKITFPLVTSNVILGINKSYQFQDWKLTCGGTRLYNAVRNGAAREFSYAPLTCKIIGSR